jgi:Peptidase_C39 like family
MRARHRAARLAAVMVVWLGAGWLAMSGPSALADGPGAVADGPGALAGAPGSSADIQSAAAQPAALVTDNGFGVTTKVGLPAPVMSTAMLQANAARQALARGFVRAMQSDAAALSKCTSKSCPTSLPAARNLKPTQQAQLTDYWCGPATVSEMLAQMGKAVSQRKAARELGTTSDGTGWSDMTGYPVPEVLNQNEQLNNYVAVGLPWAPTSHQIKTFEIDLVTDINHNGGVPLAGDAYEVPGGPHLVGHPVNQTIFHWFDIRGYKNSGATTDYEDSVHGASSIGWAATVPAYSSLPSATIVSIVGARGYDW